MSPMRTVSVKTARRGGSRWYQRVSTTKIGARRRDRSGGVRARLRAGPSPRRSAQCLPVGAPHCSRARASVRTCHSRSGGRGQAAGQGEVVRVRGSFLLVLSPCRAPAPPAGSSRRSQRPALPAPASVPALGHGPAASIWTVRTRPRFSERTRPEASSTLRCRRKVGRAMSWGFRAGPRRGRGARLRSAARSPPPGGVGPWAGRRPGPDW